MKNILVAFEYDSFSINVSAYKIFSEYDWEMFMNALDEYVPKSSIDFYAGENICIQLKSGKQFLELCEVQYKVTEQEIKTLQKLKLNLEQFDIFEQMIKEMRF